jgi:hypothetical protein
MTGHGAYGDEVHSLRHISDYDAGRLLGGDLPAGDESLDELAAFVRDVGVAYSEPPTEPERARHLDAMWRAARSGPVERSPLAEPLSSGTAADGAGPGLPKLLRRRLASLAPRPRLAGAMAALALCASFSGLTALGALPEPVQAAVADAARAVGVSVPDPRAPHAKKRPKHRRPQPQPPTSAPSAPAPPAPAAAAPAPRTAPPPEATQEPDACVEDCPTDGWEVPQPELPSEDPPPGAPAEEPAPALPADPAAGTLPTPDASADEGQAGDPAP